MARDEAELLAMGARIKELRKSHGYKQQWIADQVGVALRTFQFWQAGAFPPEQENLRKLAKLFGVTPKYILRGETPDLSNENGNRKPTPDPQLGEILQLVRGLDERLTQLQEAQAEAVVRDAEAQKQIEEGIQAIRRSLPPPPP